MSQIVAATFQDGVLKPEVDLSLAPGTKVRLIVDRWDDVVAQAKLADDELEQLCATFPIESNEGRLTRDQLHERG